MPVHFDEHGRDIGMFRDHYDRHVAPKYAGRPPRDQRPELAGYDLAKHEAWVNERSNHDLLLSVYCPLVLNLDDPIAYQLRLVFDGSLRKEYE